MRCCMVDEEGEGGGGELIRKAVLETWVLIRAEACLDGLVSKTHCEQ